MLNAKTEGVVRGDDTQVLVEDQQGLANRIHDRLNERAAALQALGARCRKIVAAP
jgi:hypothetical protein